MSTGGGPSGPRRDQDAGDEQTFADVLNAFSFGNSRRRRKGSGSRDAPQDAARHEWQEAPPAAADGQFGQAAPADEQFGQAPPSDGQFGHALPADGQFGQAAPADDQPPAWEPGIAERGGSPAFVRAYVWTGGRTRSRHNFEVETLVSAGEPIGAAVTEPYSTVLGLCQGPRSVAEVAALLAMPLGVTVVVLGDMADQGLINVHGADTGDGGGPSSALMERVLIGLRQL